MFQVVKRDGEIADFQMSKITSAIDKAFDAKEKIYSKDMIDLLGLRVTADFQNKIQKIREFGSLLSEEYREDGIFVKARVPAEIFVSVMPK